MKVAIVCTEVHPQHLITHLQTLSHVKHVPVVALMCSSSRLGQVFGINTVTCVAIVRCIFVFYLPLPCLLIGMITFRQERTFSQATPLLQELCPLASVCEVAWLPPQLSAGLQPVLAAPLVFDQVTTANPAKRLGKKQKLNRVPKAKTSQDVIHAGKRR